MRILWISLLFFLIECEGKPKKHSKDILDDVDFSFEELEDIKTPYSRRKKTWIWDPSSDLCQVLKCRKSERCLLEDELTAACVDSSEIKENGDVIVPKSKSPIKKKHHNSKFLLSGEPTWAELKDCTPCPVIKPDYICGSDNNTYSSQCRLDYYNCIHDTHIAVDCHGFCPCKEKINKFEIGRRQNEKKKKSSSMTSYSPSLKELSVQLMRVNEELDEISSNSVLQKDNKKKGCSKEDLSVLGDRMIDWFNVVMSSAKKERAAKRNRKSKVYFPSNCPIEVQWMLGHLDSNGDGQLSLKELYSLEHDKYEPCIKPLLDECDTDKDMFLTGMEWCSCFKKARRPCLAMKKKISPGLLGAYKPSCDSEGFFKEIQCHSAVGLCWCVDKHGVEKTGTRTRGKPHCSGKKPRTKLEKVDSDDDVDDTYDFEGSADDENVDP